MPVKEGVVNNTQTEQPVLCPPFTRGMSSQTLPEVAHSPLVLRRRYATHRAGRGSHSTVIRSPVGTQDHGVRNNREYVIKPAHDSTEAGTHRLAGVREPDDAEFFGMYA